MADFSKGFSEERRAAQESNPFQPTGLGQLASGWDPQENAQNPFGPADYSEASQEWFGGRNTSAVDGTRNGWDTAFFSEMMNQRDLYMDKAAQADDMREFFNWFDVNKNPDATGVVVWNDQARGLRAGDVYERGQFKHNVYDIYDKAEADLLLSAVMFDGPEQARINESGGYGDGGREVRAQKVQAFIDETSEWAAGAVSAGAFKERLDAKKAEYGAGGTESAIGSAAAGGGAGAITGAGIGAVAGSVVPVAGTAAGAAVGAVIGGLLGAGSAWMNRDQITEVAARASVKAEMAGEQNGYDAGIFAAVQGVGEVGMLAGQIGANTVQGLFDGFDGDGVADFYAVDPETGRTKPSGLWEGANLAATLGDSILQFASPTGRALYMGTMGTYTGGKLGSVVTSDAVFNEERGTWDTLENPSEYFGAYGSVAIDAVQMGTVGAFAQRTKSIQQAAGVTPKTDADAVSAMWRVLPGGKDIPRAAAGAKPSEVASGLRLWFDDAGRVVAARPSIQLFAPSESFRYVMTGNRARRTVLKAADAGRASADDFYRAHLDLAYNSTRWQNAVMTGFAEAGEEAVQALLDPMGYGGDIDGMQVAKSAAYGFASGAGMALGSQLHLGKPGMRGRSDQMAIMRQRARENVELANNMQFASQEEWETFSDSFSDEMITALATRDPAEAGEMGKIVESGRQLQAYEEGVNNPLGLYAVDDMTTAAAASGTEVPNGFGQLKLMPMVLEFSFAGDGTITGYDQQAVTDAQFSWWQVARRIQLKIEMIQAHAKDTQATIVEAEAALAAAQEGGDQRLVDEAQAIIDGARQDLQDQQELAEATEVIASQLAQMERLYHNEPDARARQQMVNVVNTALRDAADNGIWVLPDGGQLQVSDPEIIQRAVEILWGRQPLMGKGSRVRLVPQISFEMTQGNAHGQIRVHQAVLKAMNGDYDGDDLVDLSGVYIPKPTREALRRGADFLASDPKQEGDARKVGVVMDPPDQEARMLYTLRTAAVSGDARESFLNNELDVFVQWMKDRYDGVFDAAFLDQVIAKFVTDVRKGDADARENLLTALAQEDRTAFLLRGEQDRVQEVPHLHGQVTLLFEKVQRKLALYTYAQHQDTAVVDPAPVRNATMTFRNAVLEQTATTGADLSLVLGADAQRAGQKVHYLGWVRAAVGYGDETTTNAALQPDIVADLAREYMLLGSNEIDTAQEKIDRQDLVVSRVRGWLDKMVDGVEQQLGRTLTQAQRGAMQLVIAQTATADFDIKSDGSYSNVSQGQVSIAQMLLRRSVQMARLRYEQGPADSDVAKRLAALERITRPQSTHSYSASSTIIEVFGGAQLQELLGDLHASLGPNLTVNQLQQELIGDASFQRSQKIHQMRNGIGYLKHHGLGDPPYVFDGPEGVAQRMLDGTLNGYTILVDALAATADTHYKALASRDETVTKSVTQAFKKISELISQWEARYRTELKTQYPKDATEQQKRRIILLDMMRNDPTLPETLQGMFTEESRYATFAIDQKTGEVLVKAWVMDALTEKDADRAAVKYYVGSHLDQFEQLGAKVAHENREKAASIDAKETVQGVPYGRIRSRFLQNLYTAAKVAEIDGGLTLNQLEQAMYTAKNLDELFAVFNDNPLVMNGREKLLPWYDDIADFETAPNEMFGGSMPGAVMRERFEKMTNRLENMDSQRRAQTIAQEKSRLTIDRMVKRFMEIGGQDADLLTVGQAATGNSVDGLLLKLKLAIEHRKRIPDFKGMNAYDQAIEAAQQALIVMHDKAKADERLRNLGQVLFGNTTMGWYGGVQLELNNVTTLDYADVATNLTKLTEGPVRIMYTDGSYTPIVDLSTVAGALSALSNPHTEMFARAALFPTTLDVSLDNVLQAYSANSNPADLEDALQQEDFRHLFGLTGDNAVERAYTYIGMVESAALADARERSSDDQANASHQLLHLINDFVTVYMHSPDAQSRNDKRMRQQLVVDIADALQRVAMIKSPKLREKALNLLRERLTARVKGNDPIEKLKRDDPKTFKLLNQLLEQEAADRLNDRQQQLTRTLASLQPGSQEYIDAIEEAERLQAVAEETPLRIMRALNPQAQFVTVETALSSFAIDETTEESKAASIERVLNYLGSFGRLHRMQSKDNALLIAQTQEMIGQLADGRLNPEDVAAADWSKLTELAATVMVAQSLSPTAAWVGLTEIDVDDPIQTSYYDYTFSYLADRLFDPHLVAAAEFIGEAAMQNVETGDNVEDFVQYLLDKLFKQERLGEWTTRVPAESVKLRRAINGTPAGSVLSAMGSIPKTMQAYVNQGMVTFAPVDPAQHHSVAVIDASRDDDIAKLLVRTPQDFIRLEHHFVSGVTLTSPDMVEAADLLADAALQSFISDEVAQSGYKVLTLARLQTAVDKFLQANPQVRTYQLQIEYVDVDKRPPTADYVNNIYFDGVGREFEGNSGTSPVAAMFFNTAALNNLGQQRPLDFMKSGFAFYAYQTQDFRKVLNMENSATSVSELMHLKALHMWGIQYETGNLQWADLPALYKLIKFRHVIRTEDGSFIWPEEAIALENQALQAGEPLPTFEVIPISDSVAKTLFQQDSLEGVPGSVRGMPLLNQQGVSQYPPLDVETLRRLGVENLGAQRDLAQSPAATVGLLNTVHLNDDRGATTRTVRSRRIPVQDLGITNTVFARRQQQTTGDNTPARISARNEELVLKSIDIESLIPGLASVPAEQRRQQDLIDDLQASQLAARIAKLKPSSLNVTWLLTGSVDSQKVSGMATGVLSKVDVENGFEDQSSNSSVVYGDPVAVDLVGIRDGLFNGNNEEAMRYITTALKQLSEKGTPFILMSKGGASPTLRGEIADWITANLPYQSMAGSSYFFEPITELNDQGATSRAEQSSLTATHTATGRGVGLLLVNPTELALSEGAAFVYEDRYRELPRWLNVIIPTQFTTTNPDLNPYGPAQSAYSFGLPQDGLGNEAQLSLVADMLLPLLKSEEGKAALRSLAAAKTGSADPDGLPLYREYIQGDELLIDPGVRSFDDAMLQLIDALQTGKLLQDRTLLPGDLIPVIDSKGHLVLTRYGFDFPVDFQQQFNQREQQNQLADLSGATTPFKIAISPATLVPTQTIPPPFKIVEMKRTPRGIEARGSYPLPVGKIVGSYEGLKLGPTNAPKHIRPLNVQMSLEGQNNLTLFGETSEKAVVGKGATQQLVNNFRNAFAVFGISFEDPLIDFFGQFYDTSTLDRDEQMDLIRGFLKEWSNLPINMTKGQLLAMLDTNQVFENLRVELEPVLQAFFPQLSYDRLMNAALPGASTQEDVNERIATLVMGTLALPGVNFDDVIGSTGFLNLESLESDQVTKFMPSILTQALDDYRFPATRQWLFDRMNSRLRRGPNGEQVYRLDPNWDFSYTVTDAAGNNPVFRTGTLNFNMYTPAEESPVVQANSQVTRTTQRISPHMVGVIDMITDGGRVPISPDRLKETGVVVDDFTTEWFTTDNAVRRIESGPASPMRGLLPQIRKLDDTFNHLQQRTYLEQRVMERADGRMRLYAQPIEKGDWDLTEIQPLADRILRTLNLDGQPASANDAMLDMLVRQYIGAPGQSADQEEFTDVQAGLYKETLTIIRDNLLDGLNPLQGGQVPLPHARLFLERVFQAQKGQAERWSPLARSGSKTRVGADDWSAWVQAIIGQVKTSTAEFESMFSSDLNGFWQSYTAVTMSTVGLPLTPNEMVNAQLASPNKEEGFAEADARWDEISLTLSLDPAERALMRNPILLETMDRTLETLLGKDQVFNGSDAPNVIASALHDKKNMQGSWRAQNKLAKAEKPGMIDFVNEGRVTIDTHVQGTRFGRSLVNLSIINRLLNPGIWVSGLIEVPVMSTLQGVSDVLTGQRLGAGGVKLAQAAESLGIQSQYTPEEVESLNALARSLGANKLWMTELIRELNYQVEIMKNDPRSSQRVSIALENAATRVAQAMSDPRFGTRMTGYARQYLGGVLEYINSTNTNQISVDQLVTLMSRNPLAIKELMNGEGMNAHQLGLNRLSNTRGTKPTMLGKAIMLPIHSLIAKESVLLNFPGHLLQIPFAFTSFNAGRLTALTGMSGWDQLIAMFFDARRKPAFLAKRPGDAWDNMDVLETVDLQKTFIRSGSTFTMLMLLGLQFGRLGLGGGDEEDRRRERLSKYLNIPNYLDPREPENSFTFADAMYLDNIPFLGNMFKNDAGNSAVVPHWIIRQFSSPILGMSRFFENGDFREIAYGFQDAYSALPNTATRVIFQADQLAGQLALEAQAEARREAGDPNAAAMTSNLLLTAVGTLERALIENAFVNYMYTALDEYDRNPFQVPRTMDESTDGLDRTQGTELPQRTDARTAIVTGEGEDSQVIQPYLTRSGWQGTLHNYTKNNAVASVLASLFTGQGLSGSYNRQNMVVKQKVVERQELTNEQGQALVYAAFMGQGGEFRLTESEIVRVLKSQWEASTDERWEQSELEARAKIIYDANNGSTALSTVTGDGQEILTKYGNTAVIRGLWKGTTELGAPELRGIALTREQRDEIAEEMLTEIKQDAIDLGLGTEAANFVMNRIWYGDKETGTVGLQSIIYSRDIPVTNTLRYNQLNVMFALGPDGRPWATPFNRQMVAQAFGIPIPHTIHSAGPGTSLDKLGKVVDEVSGINTGLHGLVRQQEPELDPLEADQILDKVSAKTLKPNSEPYVTRKKYGSGYGSGGYGGGYSRPFFQRMDDLRWGTTARTDSTPFINTSNPYIRRSRINRERVFSDRGRLNQWQ